MLNLGHLPNALNTEVSLPNSGRTETWQHSHGNDGDNDDKDVGDNHDDNNDIY